MIPLPWSAVLAIGAAYLVGAIPFGLLTGKLVKGIDLREHGSRNIGATNAGRVLGTKWGLIVLLLDALKGLLPTLLLPLLVADDSARPHVQVGCGIATIVGHMFPCWLGFRGGKGVATSLGVISILAPWGTVAAFGTFVLVFVLSRIVSLSSLSAAVVFAITQAVLLGRSAFTEAGWSLGLFSLAVPLLVIVRHRENIGRLLRGEESRFRSGSPQPSEPTEPPPAA